MSIYRTSIDGEHWTMIEEKTRDDAAKTGARIHQGACFWIGRFTKAGLQETEFIDIEYKKR